MLRTWLFLLLLLSNNNPAQSGAAAAVKEVAEAQLVDAMRQEKGYDIRATSNVARFQARVILRLAQQAREAEPDGPPLRICHKQWFDAFLKVNGLSARHQAPLFARLALAHRQDQIIEYRSYKIVDVVKSGDSLRAALSIKVYWPEDADLPNFYSFEDTLASPILQVTNHRVIRYRLLDFGDRIVYDQISGLSGRPVSGLLGALFKVIGEGRILRTVMAFSDDGVQVTWAHAKKGPFSIGTIATVQPNGTMTKGIPKGRDDLAALEISIKRRFEIKYLP